MTYDDICWSYMVFPKICCNSDLHTTSMPVGGAAAWWAVRTWSPWRGWWWGTGHAPQLADCCRSGFRGFSGLKIWFTSVWGGCHVFKHLVYWVLIVRSRKRKTNKNNFWHKNSRPHPSPQTAPHDQQADPVSLCGASPAQSPQPCTTRAVTWLQCKKNAKKIHRDQQECKCFVSNGFRWFRMLSERPMYCKSCSTQAPQARICCPGWCTVLTARALCAASMGEQGRLNVVHF